jgi:MscS family membrane protein
MLTQLLDIDYSFFDREFMGEKVENYCWFVGIILATLLLKKPVSKLLAKLSNRLTEKLSKAGKDHAVSSTINNPIERLIQTVLYYIAINNLTNLLNHFALRHKGKSSDLDIRVSDIVDHVFLFFFIIFLTQCISRVVDFTYKLRMHNAQKEQNRSQQQLLPLVKEMAKLFLWTLAIFWMLGSVFHVNVPALITGLGIGGVAIALAGKTTVENLFAAFTILSDKPFQTGETIRLDTMEGTVERIGFRSTRLRGSDGAAYVIPNQNLVGGNLVNLSFRDTRGIKLTINLSYNLSHGSLTDMLNELRETLKNTPPVKDPIEIRPDTYGEKTFTILVSYHVPNPLPEGIKLSEVQQKINLLIYGIVSKYAGKDNAVIQNN